MTLTMDITDRLPAADTAVRKGEPDRAVAELDQAVALPGLSSPEHGRPVEMRAKTLRAAGGPVLSGVQGGGA
jgi:hypothetical protein